MVETLKEVAEQADEAIISWFVALPFNALSATQLFNSMGKEKSDAK